MSMLFCNIGWMENYDGLNHGDGIVGGGRYIKENKRGFEICNFSRTSNGLVYGYVQPTHKSNSINLERISDRVNDDFIDDVTVIWTAKREGMGTVVVGWYLHARVYRYFQEFEEEEAQQHISNGVNGYYVTAKAEDSHLLKVDERVLCVPRREKGAMGQSNVWYADQPLGIKFSKKVNKYITQNEKDSLNHLKSKKKKSVDPILKLRVEKSAIELVFSYYENLGYEVKSVERDNKGYDLVAKNEKIELLIEVKGLSGIDRQIGLTPNEYKFFQSNDVNYRLIVVSSALSEPKMTICRFSSEAQSWIIEDDEVTKVNIQEKISAIITIN